MRFRVVAALALSPLLFGCASSPALRAAEAHDLPALAREIATEVKGGGIDRGDAQKLARAVATHEIKNAKGDDGAKTIVAFAQCSRVLDDVLATRGESGDDNVAAAAVESRLESGKLSPASAREIALQKGGKGPWRAIETRALVTPDDGPVRRERLLDGDQDVRVSALHASFNAGDVADTDLLLETARLDPYPLARSLAVRALARVATGEGAVLALRDLWVSADENTRQSIADAWGTERAIDVGGRRELIWASEHARGAPAISAASALARWKGEGWDEAIAVLARAIRSGPTSDRVFAIGVSPTHEAPIEEALRASMDDKDDAVVVAVAWRLLSGVGREVPEAKDRKVLVAKLMEYAKSSTTRGFQAQKALARSGVREVIPFLEKQVSLKDTRARETTGVAFVDLREFGKAASFIADDDLGVRAAVVCAVLQAPSN